MGAITACVLLRLGVSKPDAALYFGDDKHYSFQQLSQFVIYPVER
jgi:hypothetical protein